MNATRANLRHEVQALEPVRILLAEAIDYAGLFPPAALEMDAAVANFARYLAGGCHWMLGSFVVPAERLMELEPLLKKNRAHGWRISALLTTPASADTALAGDPGRGREFKQGLKSIVEFHLKAGERAHVDSVEFKIESRDELNPILELLPHNIQAYAELSVSGTLAEQIEAIRMARICAKIRTGGVTASGFPRLQQVARFISACALAGVPFKATAGLHHPLRGVYSLNGARRAPHVPMHGFLNVLIAAAAAKAGAMELQLPEILAERGERAFAFHKHGLNWRRLKISNRQLREAREQVVMSFGSCSFDQPVEELRALELL
ncbi:MAG: hypothetical protein ABSD88_11875 [Candidatus Korobacteraceae bacterium]